MASWFDKGTPLELRICLIHLHGERNTNILLPFQITRYPKLQIQTVTMPFSLIPHLPAGARSWASRLSSVPLGAALCRAWLSKVHLNANIPTRIPARSDGSPRNKPMKWRYWSRSCLCVWGETGRSFVTYHSIHCPLRHSWTRRKVHYKIGRSLRRLATYFPHRTTLHTPIRLITSSQWQRVSSSFLPVSFSRPILIFASPLLMVQDTTCI